MWLRNQLRPSPNPPDRCGTGAICGGAIDCASHPTHPTNAALAQYVGAQLIAPVTQPTRIVRHWRNQLRPYSKNNLWGTISLTPRSYYSTRGTYLCQTHTGHRLSRNWKRDRSYQPSNYRARTGCRIVPGPISSEKTSC